MKSNKDDKILISLVPDLKLPLPSDETPSSWQTCEANYQACSVSWSLLLQAPLHYLCLLE